jgi:hypothetical protein
MYIRGSATVACVALAFALIGCGGGRDAAGSGSSPTPSASPAEVLVQAAGKLDEGTYSFQFRNAHVIGAGSVDGRDGWLSMQIVGGRVGLAHLTFMVLHLDSHYLVRSDPLTGDQWARLDIKKVVPARRDMFEDFDDPARVTDLFAGIVSAEQVSERRFRGTLDLTKVADPDSSRLVDKQQFRSLDRAKIANVRFEATLDAQGRPLGVRLTLPATAGEPEQTAEISYMKYGTKPDLQGPFKGEIGTAPPSAYAVINE